MEFVKALILGVVQGLTEFLPISSSGHLVMGSEILNFKQQSVAFDVFLHLGTLVSVLIVFRREIAAMLTAPFQYVSGDRSEHVVEHLKWDLFVLIATLPAIAVGLFLKDHIDKIFSSLPLVFVMLSVTGVLMLTSKYLHSRNVRLASHNSFLIGCAQALAIMPGLSRSGSTIFTGMALGIDRQLVAKFSFIMSIPAILGAVVLHLGDLLATPPAPDSLVNIAVGTLAAAVSGYFAIVLLLDIVRKNRLQYFGYYCLFVSLCGFFYLLTGDM